MRKMVRILSAFLCLSMLIASLPVSAFADDLQEMQIMDMISAEEALAQIEMAAPEEEILMQQEMVLEDLPEMTDISETDEIPPEAPTGLAELPEMMELPVEEAGQTEVPAEQEPVDTEVPAEEEESADVQEPAEEVIPEDAVLPEGEPEQLEIEEAAQPVALPAVEYVKTGAEEGAVPADLNIVLPEAAMPVVEIEGLVWDADYWMADGALMIAAPWLSNQQGDEIFLTIHGADMLTYIQPIALLQMEQEEMQLMNSGEYDVSRLFVNGEPVSNGSGEGWEYADGDLTVDLNHSAMTLSGSANLKRITVLHNEEMDTYALTLDSLNVYCDGKASIHYSGTGTKEIVVNIVGENRVSGLFEAESFDRGFVGLYGEGILHLDQPVGAALQVYGPAVNAVSCGQLTIHSGVVNLSGNDNRGVYGNFTINGGELNIRKEADGLNFIAINGNYTQTGGKVNIDLSGNSDFRGIYVTQFMKMNDGELEINIKNAKSAEALRTGSWVNNSKQTGGSVKINLENIAGSANGIYLDTDGGVKLNAGAASIEINGAEYAKGIASAYNRNLSIDGGALDIRLENARQTACGIMCTNLTVYDGSLNILGDMVGDDHIALSCSKATIEGGSVYMLAPRLSSNGLQLTVPDGSKLPLEGSMFAYENGEVRIKNRKQFFVDGVGQYSYPEMENASGEGWDYDYDSDTLYLNNFSGESIGVFEGKDSFTINLSGENHLGSIETSGIAQTEITGSGSLNMTAAKSSHGCAIDVEGALRISGCDVNLKKYSEGIAVGGLLEIKDANLEIEKTGYGLICAKLDIDAASELNVQTVSAALVCLEEVILAGEAVQMENCNEIEIRNGEILKAVDNKALTMNGTIFSDEELQQDISGDGWNWIAGEQKLMLGNYTGTVDSSRDLIHIYATESTNDVSISARNLTLSADAGVWFEDAYIAAENLEVLSGNYVLQDDASMILDNLTISGGSLKAPAGIEVLGKALVSGGKLEAGVLLAMDMDVLGGSVYVRGGQPFTEEADGVQVTYGFVVEDFDIKGGTLYTAEPAFFGSYYQQAGTVELAKNAASASNKIVAAVGASTEFVANGGKLTIHNGYGYAVLAEKITLQPKLSANIYGDSGLFYASTVVIAGKLYENAGAYTTLVMDKGKVKTLTVESKPGLAVGNAIYGKHIVENSDLSGKGWTWNHSTKTLTISNMRGSYDADIYIDSGSVTLHLPSGDTKENNYLDIYSAGALTITGDGELDQARISSPKAIKVKGSQNLSRVDFYTNSTLAFENVQADGIYYEAGSSVTISNSNINFEGGVATNKNLTIKNSDLYYWLDEYDTSTYANGKTSITNSILTMEGKIYSKKGTSIGKDAAVFKRNWSTNQYELQKSVTLSRDWTLSGSYVVPNKIKLTVKSGKTLYVGGVNTLKTSGSGSISGNVVVLASGAMESIQIDGPNALTIGASVQLTANTMPENNRGRVIWTSSDIGLCEVNASGLVTATKDASGAGKRVTITAVYAGNEEVFAAHEILLVPAAEEVVARDANGRYTKSAELWLDPENKTAQLEAKVYPYAALQDVTWKSSDSKIVSVDANGVITAKKAGSANVYAIAADGSKIESQKVKVTVRKAPSSIKFTTKSPTLGYDSENGTGSSVQLKVQLSSGSASTVKFTSANESIAVVDENGVVTATGAGKVKITAQTYNQKKASLTVNVKAAPESITISTRELTIGVGMSHKFTASIPKNSYGNWFFNVGNACGAVNAGTGEFLALKPGDVEVSVTTFNGKMDSCIVHVLPAPEVIELNKNAVELGVGEKFTLEPTGKTLDGSAAKGSYTYSTSQKSVATVGSDGKITAKKVGTAKIIVTAHNGVTAECDVVVAKAPTSVKLSKTATLTYDAAAGVGQQMKLDAVLSSKSVSALSWKSSNKDVVAVDSQGNIVATGIGKAKITVQTFNKKTATCTVTVKAAE